MGVLTKNAPLLAMIATCWLLERGGWTSAALWTLRVGMASIWLLEGLLPAQIDGDPTLPNIVRFMSRGMITEPRAFLRVIGLLQAASAIAVLLLRGPLLGLLVLGHLLGLVVICVVITCYDPLAWVHPFGPATKNISIFIGTLLVLRRLRETGQC